MIGLPTACVLVMPDGRMFTIAVGDLQTSTRMRPLTHGTASAGVSPSEIEVVIRGIVLKEEEKSVDSDSTPTPPKPLLQTADPHDAGGEMVSLRCPRCNHFDEAHDCDGSFVDRPAVEEPVVVPTAHPTPDEYPPELCAAISPGGLHCARLTGHTGDHISLSGAHWAVKHDRCGETSVGGRVCMLPIGHDGDHVGSSGVRWFRRCPNHIGLLTGEVCGARR